jgi:hypothetical protein
MAPRWTGKNDHLGEQRHQTVHPDTESWGEESSTGKPKLNELAFDLRGRDRVTKKAGADMKRPGFKEAGSISPIGLRQSYKESGPSSGGSCVGPQKHHGPISSEIKAHLVLPPYQNSDGGDGNHNTIFQSSDACRSRTTDIGLGSDVELVAPNLDGCTLPITANYTARAFQLQADMAQPSGPVY